MRLRIDNQRRNDGDERDAAYNAADNSASNQLFAPALGSLCLELGIGLFVGNLDCIVRAAVLRIGLHVCYQREHFGRTLGHVLGIIGARGDRGDI